MLEINPSTAFRPTLRGAPTGLVGTLSVKIEDPDGNTVVAATTAGITEVDPGIYSATLTAPAARGTYLIIWTASGTRTSEDLRVTYDAPPASTPGPNLITLEEAQIALGVPATSTSKIAALEQAIPWVGAVVRKVTDRDFGSSEVAEEREFTYDGSGFLEVDDYTDLTSLKINNVTVPATQLAYGPDRAPEGVYYWIEGLPRQRPYGSPEMGFTRNEDTLPSTALQRPARAQVSATWGWSEVPDDVKQAVVWILAAYIENPSPFISESIEGYSRTRALPAGADTAIPGRAWDLLGLFARGQM